MTIEEILPILDAMTEDQVSWFLRNDISRTHNCIIVHYALSPIGMQITLERHECNTIIEGLEWLCETYTEIKKRANTE